MARDLSHDHRWLSLNTATVRAQGDFLAIVEACARHGVRAVSPWRDQVAAVGLGRGVAAVKDSGLELSGYCRGGMFTGAPERRQEIIDDNRRAIDEAAALGAPCLIVVVGGLPQFSRPGSPPSRDNAAARGQVVDILSAVLDHAAAAKVPLALEPLHPIYAADRACVNTLGQALDICEALDPAATGRLGVTVDTYHTWWDPELNRQIARAGRRILAFHVCDWLVPTTDLLEDRGMMGDGVIDIRRIRGQVEAQGFAGYCEAEILSRRWWAEPIDTVIETCIARHRSVV
jgi:sugar phosphate isomerase/epimerase